MYIPFEWSFKSQNVVSWYLSLQELRSQHIFEDVSYYSGRSYQKTVDRSMDNHAQSNGQVFVTPTPFVNQRQREINGASSATYPPNYRVVTQQQQVSFASGKCKSIFAGRISTYWLGSLLLVSSFISVVGAVFASGYYAGLSEIYVGIWCGFMILPVGTTAIPAGCRDYIRLMYRTIVTSALAIVASITQLVIAGIGLSNDNGTGNGDGYSCDHLCDHPNTLTCSCVDNNYKAKAIASNATLVGVAALAFIAGVWILVVACIAIRRKSASFQGVSVPAQAQVQYRYAANAAQPNVYESTPHQRGVSVPAQPVANAAQSTIYEYIPHHQCVSVPEQAVANDAQSTIYENIPHQQITVWFRIEMHDNTRSVRASPAVVPATDVIEPSTTEHHQSINISSSGLSEC